VKIIYLSCTAPILKYCTPICVSKSGASEGHHFAS
jgi:hypothetical protein